jgi:hypothetical protein
MTMPATKFASGRCAAKPTTRPTMAEDASRPAAIARTCGTTSSAERIPTTMIAVIRLRRRIP